jgi:hypothetical protein
VVIVLPRGRVDAAELREVRAILRHAGIRPLSLVLTGRTRRPVAGTEAGVAGPLPSLPPRLLTTLGSNHRGPAEEPLLAVTTVAGDGGRQEIPDSKHKGTALPRRGH